MYSHGIAERMKAGRVRQAANVDDWLLICFHDAVDVVRGGRVRKVAAGSLMAWAPGKARDYGSEAGEWTHSWVQVTGRRVAGVLAGAGIYAGKPWPAGGAEGVERGLRRLHEEVTVPARPEPRILGNLFENWLWEMKRAAAGPAEDARDAGARLRKVKNRLDTEHGRTVTLAEMARWASMSPSHLSASFREEFGEAPVAYHIARRMDAARYLLAMRTLPVGEVGAAVGYPDAAGFSRMFKRVVGVGPRAYREGGGTE